jgi:soluble lytic murein transglycosylase
MALANDPNSVMTFARTTGATDFTRQMAAVAFASVARQDVENARLMIPSLVQAQQLNEDQTQELRDIVAWRLMGNDVTEEQAIWRDDAIMRSQSTRWWSAGCEWRWARGSPRAEYLAGASADGGERER